VKETRKPRGFGQVFNDHIRMNVDIYLIKKENRIRGMTGETFLALITSTWATKSDILLNTD
jgi:hypothetical protein